MDQLRPRRAVSGSWRVIGAPSSPWPCSAGRRSSRPGRSRAGRRRPGTATQDAQTIERVTGDIYPRTHLNTGFRR